jgi:D-serine deaminase-like pyridoxal phosphate-dependent protein
MLNLKNVVEPTLLLDEEKCRSNIRFMAEKARRHHLRFRPHFKTHQSLAIGDWFRDEGVDRITVSSLNMALYFAGGGWPDITVAFPANVREMAKIEHLARNVKLNLLVTAGETVKALDMKMPKKVGVYIKVDTGYHRAGIPSERIGEIDALLKTVTRSRRLFFRGFLAHNGHTYAAGSRSEIKRIHHDALGRMNRLKDHYLRSFPDLELSLGDTPACSVAEDFRGIDEIRPGNFVFYDVMQYRLDACSRDRIAVCLACPITGRSRHPDELLIYGGAVHLSKEYVTENDGGRNYGMIVKLSHAGWTASSPGLRLIHLSQEHGLVGGMLRPVPGFKPGGILGVLPIHSCLTANLMKGYLTLTGKRIANLAGNLTFPVI